MVALVVLFVRYVANPLTERLARAPELLVIFAIAQAAIFAAIGDLVGLGKEVGGLLAGVSLASTPYRETIAARLAPLRDFLLLFFFIALGATLDLSLLGAHVTGAIVFSLFVLIGNPLIVLAIMGAMGYRKRTGFLAGLTVAQISEFSLIFVAMGVSLGHVGQDALGLVTMVGLVTIAASTYMITYSHQLYALFEPLLGIFERKGTPREPSEAAEHRGAESQGDRFRTRPVRNRHRDAASASRCPGPWRRLQPARRPTLARTGTRCRVRGCDRPGVHRRASAPGRGMGRLDRPRPRQGPELRGHPHNAHPADSVGRVHGPRRRDLARGAGDRGHAGRGRGPRSRALPGRGRPGDRPPLRRARGGADRHPRDRDRRAPGPWCALGCDGGGLPCRLSCRH
jgi:hypothetical protein